MRNDAFRELLRGVPAETPMRMVFGGTEVDVMNGAADKYDPLGNGYTIEPVGAMALNAGQFLDAMDAAEEFAGRMGWGFDVSTPMGWYDFDANGDLKGIVSAEAKDGKIVVQCD